MQNVTGIIINCIANYHITKKYQMIKIISNNDVRSLNMLAEVVYNNSRL